MKSRVQLACLLSMILIFVSCGKSDSPGPDPEPGNELPPDTMYITSIVNDADSIAIEYNDDKTLRSYSVIPVSGDTQNMYSWRVRYENGLLKSAYQKRGPQGTERLMLDFTTNQAGQIEKRFIANLITGDMDTYDSLAYNAQGQLIAAYHYDKMTGKLSSLREYTWQDNNLVKVLTVSSSTLFPGLPADTITTTYKYGDKVNAFTGLKVMAHITTLSAYYLSANNVIEEKSDGGPGNSWTATVAYTYNNKGYPLTRTMAYLIGTYPDTRIDRIRYLGEE